MTVKRVTSCVLGKVLSAAVCASLTLAGVPAGAFAAETSSGGETGIVECANGWKLAYVISGSEAYIDYVAAVGSGTLIIPQTVGEGVPVTGIGDDAFNSRSNPSSGGYEAPYEYYQSHGIDLSKSLVNISLPSTVTALGVRAFFGSGITQIELPAGFQTIHNFCFQYCESLKAVTFESVENAKNAGLTHTVASGYFGRGAFRGCVSLAEMEIPALTEIPGSTKSPLGGATEAVDSQARIGQYCFQDCTNLSKFVFYGGASDGVAGYFAKSNCFTGCDNINTVVYFCTKTSATVSTTASITVGGPSADNIYYSIDFYDNGSSDADEDGYVGTVTYPSNTDVIDLLNGKIAEEEAYAVQYATVPLPSEGLVWGTGDYEGKCALSFTSTKLSDSITAYAVDKENLNYAWITSKELISNTKAPVTVHDKRYTPIYRDETGNIPALDALEVCVGDGSTLPKTAYEIVYEEGTTSGSGANASTTWKEVSRASLDLNGSYRMTAIGVGAFADTKTSSVEFTVVAFSPAVTAYLGSDARALASMELAAAALLEETPSFDVVVPSDAWQYGLLGAGLAGVGDGLLLLDSKRDYSEAAQRAFLATKADELLIIGSTSETPQSSNLADNVYLLDLLLQRTLHSTARIEGPSVQATALTTYLNVAKYGDRNWGKSWGDTAVIMSPTKNLGILPITQYVYENDAPVFFVDANGTLTSTSISGKTSLDCLKDGDFKNIVIVGDESYVSANVAKSVESATGITPTRIMDVAGTSGEMSRAYAQTLVDASDAAVSNVIVVDALEPAAVVAAGQLAAACNGVVLTCSSADDCKAAQAFVQGMLETYGWTSVNNIWLLGSLSDIDAKIQNRFASFWNDETYSTAFESGDSVEAGGCIYRLDGNGTASLLEVVDPSITSLALDTVTYGGKAYNVTKIECPTLNAPYLTSLTLGSRLNSVPAGLLSVCRSLSSITIKSTAITSIPASFYAGLTKLKSVSYAGTVKSIGASAFKGCASLTALNAKVLNASSIGAKAFYGCTSLKTVALGTSVKSIGASAFYGCTKLSKVTVGKSVTTIGASTFRGCTALKSLTLGAKVSTIGASAFYGCKALTKVTIPAKVKKVGKKAFYSCSKLKTITIKSKKLTKKRIGANAFGKGYKRVKVKAPASKKKLYKKILVAKGLSKKATIK